MNERKNLFGWDSPEAVYRSFALMGPPKDEALLFAVRPTEEQQDTGLLVIYSLRRLTYSVIVLSPLSLNWIESEVSMTQLVQFTDGKPLGDGVVAVELKDFAPEVQENYKRIFGRRPEHVTFDVMDAHGKLVPDAEPAKGVIWRLPTIHQVVDEAFA